MSVPADNLPMLPDSGQGETEYKISLNELAGYTEQELQQAQNWAGSEFREAIKQSLNYFLLRAKGDEVPGRSQLQSGDVADMVDRVQAEIQPMYAEENIVTIDPEGEDDDQADIETEAINWYWTERLRGFDKIDEAVQDALLSRNAYLKVYYEESHGLPYTDTLEGPAFQLDAELNQLAEGNDLELLEAEVIQEAQIAQAPVTDPLSGLWTYVDVEVGPEVQRLKLKITPQLKEVRSEAPALEDMCISQDATGSNLQQPRFVAQRRRMSRQDAKALDLDPTQIDRIPTASTTGYESDVKSARKSDYNTYSRYAPHSSGEQIDLYECYYKIDRDGDGIPEMWKYFFGGNRQVLDWADGTTTAEMVRVRPFASGTILKVAHRHQGRSIYDKEAMIEDTKRAMIRQLADNLDQANNMRLAVSDEVDEDDLDETDNSKYIRCGGPPGQNMMPITFNNIAGDSLQGLAYMDKMRKERAGTTMDVGGENMPIRQGGDHTTERVMSAMETQLAMYARNLANTLIRDTFVLLHQQMRLLPGKITFQSGDEWQATEPRRWVERTRINVTMGPTLGERMRRQGALQNVIAIQRQDKVEGSVLVDPQAEYEARVDLYRAAGLKAPEQYAVDPSQPSEQVDPQTGQMLTIAQADAKAKAEQAQRAEQMAMMQQQALIQAQSQAVAMQEQTKRMSDQLDALEAQRDRLAEWYQTMTKTQADLRKAGIDVEVPGGLLEEDDEMARLVN